VRVIVVGGGEIGFALAQALAATHDVVVIDHASVVADRFEALDVQFLLGTGTSAEVLGRAGIEGADILVACTGLDEVNIVTCAIGNRLGSPRTFCFVSREDFLELQQDRQSLEQFGIDHVVWPEAQLAADIERVIGTPGALDAEVFADGAIRLVEYRLEAGSSMVGRIADQHLPHGALIVAVRRGDEFFIPRGNSELLPGDKAVIMGTPEALQDVRHRISPGADARRQRVTIIGGGDVGLRLAERLETTKDLDVVIVERDPARGELLASRLYVAGHIPGFPGPLGRDGGTGPVSPFAKRINKIWEENVGPELLDMTPDEVRTEMRKYVARGVDFIKFAASSHDWRAVRLMFSPEAMKAIVEEGHKAGITVQTHTMNIESLRLAVVAGIDMGQHPELVGVRELPDDLIKMIVERRVYCGVLAIKKDHLKAGKWPALWHPSQGNIEKLIRAGAPVMAQQLRDEDVDLRRLLPT